MAFVEDEHRSHQSRLSADNPPSYTPGGSQVTPPLIEAPEYEADAKTEPPHLYTHGDEYKSRAKLHQQAINLAYTAGARTADQVMALLPNLPCSLLFIKVNNIQRLSVTFNVPDCRICCEETVARTRAGNTDPWMDDAVAFLREETKEVIMREDWTWDALKNDRMLVALFQNPPKRPKNLLTRGWRSVVEEARVFWKGQPDPLSSRRYIEDLDFSNGEYNLISVLSGLEKSGGQ